jgi:hypothetical protein
MLSDAQALPSSPPAMVERVRDTVRGMGYSNAKPINGQWTAP